MVNVLLILAAAFEFWWAGTYLFAFSQTRVRLLMLQVAQGYALGFLLLYLLYVISNQLQVNGMIAGFLLAIAFATTVLWRLRGGVRLLIRRYPRGMFDVLTLRRPLVIKDMKQRVRTK